MSADAGALLLRELMHRLGLSRLLEAHLTDPRAPSRLKHSFVQLLRTLLLMKAQGLADQRDVNLVRKDPLFRLAVSERRGDASLRESGGHEPEGLCSQPTLSRPLAALSSPENRHGLRAALLAWAERRLRPGSRPLPEATLDLDSLPIEVYGNQPGSAWNAHFGKRCYHPAILSWDRGDFLDAALRPGNAHTAGGALAFVLPGVRWAKQQAEQVWLRMDAGFPEPKLLSALEREEVRYVARLRSNAVLIRGAEEVIRRPVGRPPGRFREWTHEMRYRVGSWKRERRVVVVVKDDPGELFLDYFFPLTNAPEEEVSAEALLERYRRRGAAEKDFGDFKSALDVALSSTPRPKRHYCGQRVRQPSEPVDAFAANEATLLVSLLAAGVLHAGRALLERRAGVQYSRQRFRELVLKLMLGEDYTGWLYNGRQATDRPADLGYWMGYQIAEAYYGRAQDRKQAIQDLLHIRNFERFLARSGYAAQVGDDAIDSVRVGGDYL